MNYNQSWHITLGSYELLLIESVEITRSVLQLSDTATIVLPGTVFNKAIEIEKKIARGDAVTIKLGYDDQFTSEFTGYIDSIATDDENIKINCEDSLFLLKKPVANKQFANPDLNTLLKYVLADWPNMQIACDYSFSYETYTIRNATAYQVIKKIQEETKANIYLKGNTLHVHPQYSELFGEVEYSFQQNIESSDLAYKNANDRIVLITVEGKGNDGKVIKATAGQTGGDTETIKIDGVSSLASLQTMADNRLKQKSYTGYSGSITGWLIPYVDAGYKATITDSEYDYKSGSYYVTEVVTTFSKEGGKRNIKIGLKI